MIFKDLAIWLVFPHPILFVKCLKLGLVGGTQNTAHIFVVIMVTQHGNTTGKLHVFHYGFICTKPSSGTCPDL